MSGEKSASKAKGHFVRGGGGVGIFAREWGPEDGAPILLIHGFSQSHASWQLQGDGPLAETHRLVAMDIRGHGYSEKPLDPAAYHDSAAIAQDVAAVIEECRLENPVLVGWSYGGVIIGDYLRIFGDQKIAGVMTVGAVFALGDTAPKGLQGEGSSHFGQLLSLDFDKQLAGAYAGAKLGAATPPTDEQIARQVAMVMMAPPPVRRGMLTRSVDHRDSYRALTKPHLVMHGEKDVTILPGMADLFAELAPGAEKMMVPDVAHRPFSENQKRFDADLAAFVARVRG